MDFYQIIIECREEYDNIITDISIRLFFSGLIKRLENSPKSILSYHRDNIYYYVNDCYSNKDEILYTIIIIIILDKKKVKITNITKNIKNS